MEKQIQMIGHKSHCVSFFSLTCIFNVVPTPQILWVECNEKSFIIQIKTNSKAELMPINLRGGYFVVCGFDSPSQKQHLWMTSQNNSIIHMCIMAIPASSCKQIFWNPCNFFKINPVSACFKFACLCKCIYYSMFTSSYRLRLFPQFHQSIRPHWVPGISWQIPTQPGLLLHCHCPTQHGCNPHLPHLWLGERPHTRLRQRVQVRLAGSVGWSPSRYSFYYAFCWTTLYFTF